LKTGKYPGGPSNLRAGGVRQGGQLRFSQDALSSNGVPTHPQTTAAKATTNGARGNATGNGSRATGNNFFGNGSQAATPGQPTAGRNSGPFADQGQPINVINNTLNITLYNSNLATALANTSSAAAQQNNGQTEGSGAAKGAKQQ
jgi:hypothetical protein